MVAVARRKVVWSWYTGAGYRDLCLKCLPFTLELLFTSVLRFMNARSVNLRGGGLTPLAFQLDLTLPDVSPLDLDRSAHRISLPFLFKNCSQTNKNEFTISSIDAFRLVHRHSSCCCLGFPVQFGRPGCLAPVGIRC